MKKSYITPVSLVVKLAPTAMLASSDPNLRVVWDEEKAVDAADVEVKRYNGSEGSVNWDDDWSK